MVSQDKAYFVLILLLLVFSISSVIFWYHWGHNPSSCWSCECQIWQVWDGWSVADRQKQNSSELKQLRSFHGWQKLKRQKSLTIVFLNLFFTCFTSTTRQTECWWCNNWHRTSSVDTNQILSNLWNAAGHSNTMKIWNWNWSGRQEEFKWKNEAWKMKLAHLCGCTSAGNKHQIEVSCRCHNLLWINLN